MQDWYLDWGVAHLGVVSLCVREVKKKDLGILPNIRLALALKKLHFSLHCIHVLFFDEVCDEFNFLLQKSRPRETKPTLVYRIDVQDEINVQVGKFLKNIKRAGQNRRAGRKFSGKLINVQGEIFWQINDNPK